jgi:hypothetical protein
VLRALPLCTCCRQYPGTATGITLAHLPSRISLPRKGGRVGLCNVLFEACSAFTHVTACTLALPPYFVARFTGGFNRFVASTIAPVASGRSSSRVGFTPTGKAPPYHGAHPKETILVLSFRAQIVIISWGGFYTGLMRFLFFYHPDLPDWISWVKSEAKKLFKRLTDSS